MEVFFIKRGSIKYGKRCKGKYGEVNTTRRKRNYSGKRYVENSFSEDLNVPKIIYVDDKSNSTDESINTGTNEDSSKKENIKGNNSITKIIGKTLLGGVIAGGLLTSIMYIGINNKVQDNLMAEEYNFRGNNLTYKDASKYYLDSDELFLNIKNEDDYKKMYQDILNINLYDYRLSDMLDIKNKMTDYDNIEQFLTSYVDIYNLKEGDYLPISKDLTVSDIDKFKLSSNDIREEYIKRYKIVIDNIRKTILKRDDIYNGIDKKTLDYKVMEDNISFAKNIKDDNLLNSINNYIEECKNREYLENLNTNEGTTTFENNSNNNDNKEFTEDENFIEDKAVSSSNYNGNNNNNNNNSVSENYTGTNIGGIDAVFQVTSETGGFGSSNIVYQWTGLSNWYLAEHMSPVGMACLGLGEGSTFWLNGQLRTVFHVEYGFINDMSAVDRAIELQNQYGGNVLQTCETEARNSTLRLIFFT